MKRTLPVLTLLRFLSAALAAVLVFTVAAIPESARADAEDCSVPAHFLSGSISTGATSANASVTNSSQTCSYGIGLASYERYPNGSYSLYSTSKITLAPGQSIAGGHVSQLQVAIPICSYELDLFQGSVTVPPDYAQPEHALIQKIQGGGQQCLNYIGGTGSAGSGSGSGGSGSGGSGSGSGSGGSSSGSGPGSRGSGSGSGGNGGSTSPTSSSPLQPSNPHPGSITVPQNPEGVGGPQVLGASTLPRTGMPPSFVAALIMLIVAIEIFLQRRFRKY